MAISTVRQTFPWKTGTFHHVKQHQVHNTFLTDTLHWEYQLDVKSLMEGNYNVTLIFIGYREPSNLQLAGLKECYIPTSNALV